MNESEMRRVFDTLVEHVVCYDRQMNIRWANRAACDSVGLHAGEIVRGKCHELWAGADEPCPDCPVTRAMATGRMHEVEKRTPDGRAWFVRAYPMTDDDGTITGGVELTLEIMGQRQTQEAYRAVVDHSLQGLVVIQDMRIVFANQAMAEISGYCVEEILAAPSKVLQDFIHPEDREMVWKSHQARLHGEPLPDRYAFRIIRKDGAVRWLEIHTSRVEYQGRSAIQAACIDVTQRIQAEEALRASERRTLALLEAMPDLMFRVDADGTFLDYKQGEDGVLYVPSEEFLGRTLVEVLPAEMAEAAMQYLKRTLQSGETQTFEYQLPMPDGCVHDFECRLVACGEREVLAIIRNITDRKRTEQLGKVQRDVAVTLSSLSNLKEGLQYCVEAAVNIAQMDCGGIYSRDDSTGDFGLKVHLGWSEAFVASASFHPADSQCAHIIMQGEPVYTTQVGLGVPLGPVQRREGLRAVAIIPIKDEGRVVACMNVASRGVDKIPQWSRVALETIAAQMGSAISRLKAREALQESERRFRSLIEQNTDAVFCYEYDPPIATDLPVEEQVKRLYDGVLVECNDVCARSYGASRAAGVVGKRLTDLFGTVPGSLEELFRAMIQAGYRAFDVEGVEKLPDGRERYYLNHGYGVVVDGKLLRVWGTFRDITDHVQAQRRLRELQDIVNRSSMLVFVWCVAPGQWPVEFVSSNVEQVLGYTPDDFAAGRVRWPDITHPDDVPRLEAEVAHHLERGQREWSQEYRLITKSGQIRWVEDQNLALRDDDGQVSRIQSIVVDVTERKLAEDALRYRLEFEELVAGISNTFVNLPVDDIDRGIKQTLTRIGCFVDVDRSYVVVLHDNGTRLSQVYEWCAEGIESYKDHAQGLEIARFPWTVEQFVEGDALNVPCVGDLQGEATQAREAMEAAGVKSLLGIPIVIGGTLFGFLGFAAVRRQRTWSSDEVSLVKIVAQVFANALERKRSAEALQKRLAFETLLSHLSAAFINLATEDINAEIERWMGQIGEFLQIDRSTIIHVPSDSGDIMTTHSWAAPDLDAAPAMLRRGEFTWFIEQLAKGEPLVFSALEDSPGDAASERRYCEKQGMKSVVAIPVVTSGLTLGAVVFSSMRKQREWSDELVQRLRLVGEIFANALLRKHAEESLLASEERFRSIFENAVLGLYRTTLDGRILMANPSLVRMLGCSCLEEVAALNVEKKGFWPGYSRQDFKERIEAAGQVAGLESAWRRRDGTALFVRENARAVRDERGRTLYYEGTVEDITEWKRTERALRESERRYRELYEGSRDGSCSVDMEGRILDCNSVFLNMLGYGKDEIHALTYEDITPVRWHAFEQHIIQSQVLTRGYSDVYEKEYVHQDGTIFPVELRTYLDRDSDGRPVGMWAFVRDISERKKAEAALRISERNYREIFNAASEAIFVHDPLTGVILDVNETTVRMLGYCRREILRRTVGELSADEPAYSQQKVLERIVKATDQNAQLFEWLLRRKDGSPLWVEVNLKSVIIGGQRRVLAGVRDITDRKRAETEAQKHLTELTRAWHANTLGEMASGLAHELNQPLCAILNYSSGCLRMMRRKHFSVETVRSSIEQIAGQAERAADIIKHIRSLMARRDPQRAELDLNTLVVDVMDMLRSEAAKREAVMISRFARHLPAIAGNAVELEQVVLNLLRNALEAMNDPDVTQRRLTVSTSVRPDGAVQVAVSDTGRGFSAELAEKIFDSFFTTKEEGLGIGLSLSRRIIETHGGRLWAESDGVSGATFTFTLPFEGVDRGK